MVSAFVAGAVGVGKRSLAGRQVRGLRQVCAQRNGASVAMAAETSSYKYVILGGGNAAGYAAKELAAQGVDGSQAAIVSREAVAPYERPALSKAVLFADPPVRLPGFFTCVGVGADRQEPDWYASKGIDLLLNEDIETVDLKGKKLSSKSGRTIEYEKLLIATGSTPIVLNKLDGADLPGIFYVREYADTLKLYDALHAHKGEEVLLIGGGYIGMEVAAAAAMVGCKPKMVFPEEHLMPRLFFPELAAKYEDFYNSKGIELLNKGRLCEAFLADENGKLCGVRVCKDQHKEDISGKLCIVGVGAFPNVNLFGDQLAMEMRGIQVDGSLETSIPDVYAVGDIASFPLKMYGGRKTRMEHVVHARQSATHAVKAMLGEKGEYDYLPYFYSRVFNLSWQFFGDNVGDPLLFGDMNPKLSAFWVEDGKVNGVFMESPTEEDTATIRSIALARPSVDLAKLKAASSADEALQVVKSSM